MKKICKKIISLAALLTLSISAYGKTIAENELELSPLLIGQHVPYIELADSDYESFSEVLDGKPTILFFYRGGWCPFCNVQMGQLQAVEKDLSKMGYQLIGISTDSSEILKESIKDKKLSYQLLSDYHSKISQAFGLAYFTSEKTTKTYLKIMDLSNPLQKNKQGQERLVLPAPAIYVIDKDGLVHFQYVNPNYKTRIDPKLLLLAAELAR